MHKVEVGDIMMGTMITMKTIMTKMIDRNNNDNNTMPNMIERINWSSLSEMTLNFIYLCGQC